MPDALPVKERAVTPDSVTTPVLLELSMCVVTSELARPLYNPAAAKLAVATGIVAVHEYEELEENPLLVKAVDPVTNAMLPIRL